MSKSRALSPQRRGRRPQAPPGGLETGREPMAVILSRPDTNRLMGWSLRSRTTYSPGRNSSLAAHRDADAPAPLRKVSARCREDPRHPQRQSPGTFSGQSTRLISRHFVERHFCVGCESRVGNAKSLGFNIICYLLEGHMLKFCPTAHVPPAGPGI